ncbi:unnamed protein product [Periconia digitata]|uniref:F-box domain-containing protein n=1 Tax=Periconia digitata TaxID=1303443 RepID=A0A9W4XG67_9PLEO|nr:unnamed protein product [Periconia digitata]
MAALSALPNELLSLITSHLDHPRDVLNIALCNRRLHHFVHPDGWKAFLRGRFFVTKLDNDAKTAVHGLTTLHRNWDSKALVARFVDPPQHLISLNSWEKTKWIDPRGQTMGYQPTIDSYDELRGTWTDRKEVLAWSAGTQVVLRIKDTGSKADAYSKSERGEVEDEQRERTVTCGLDAFKHFNMWYTYKIPDSAEGIDDITDMKLLRPHQRNNPATSEQAVFSTASGRLSIITADLDSHITREQHFSTHDQSVEPPKRRSVESLSVSFDNEPLIAAALGDVSLALYSVKHFPSDDASSQEILSEVAPIMPSPTGPPLPGRIWSCNFISNSNVALGLGPTYEPIQVYTVTPTGFHPTPLRRFNIDPKSESGNAGSGGYVPRNTSIYPVIPVPDGVQGVTSTNNIFLSGGYDGIVRLHDLRSPQAVEALYGDTSNHAPIYSLASQGPHRFLAGSSIHSMLKIFDLRYPRTYHSPSFINSSSSSNWNLFLNPRSSSSHRRRTPDSPTYSLSIPSAFSPTVYTGLEGTIQALTFTSVVDEFPDPFLFPAHRGGMVRSQDSGRVDRKKTWDPTGDVLSLGMYEQGEIDGDGLGTGIRLRVQREIERVETGRDGGATTNGGAKKENGVVGVSGLDERWVDAKDEPIDDVGRRWARGRGGMRGRGRTRRR